MPGRVLLLLFCLFALASMAQDKKKSVPPYLTELKSRADFDLLRGDPLSKTFKGIECIKIVYSLGNKLLYYMDSKRYKWHHLFTNEVLRDADDLEAFNAVNYGRSPKRKYILATFNYNVNTGNYFLQFAAADDPSDEMIRLLVDKVAATFFKGRQFKILLNTTILLRRKKELAQKHDVITSDEVFKGQSYQPICKGKAKGLVKFIDADSVRASRDYSQYILIMKGVSNEIPVCRAVVTDAFQTPLSHICLLTNNRKTPAAAQKGVFAADPYRKLEGVYAELVVGEEKMSLVAAARLPEITRRKKKLVLSSDTTTRELADLSILAYKNRKTYGSKACNLAELKKLERKKQSISTPEPAFAVPFHYYVQHARSSGAWALIEALAADSLAGKNDSLLDRRLAAIRKAIRTAPLGKSFLNELELRCSQQFGTKKIRFRSSSNCEDEVGFNGAGLYTSVTGIFSDTARTIEKAIRKVWASLWTTRAYREREFFNIDHRTVCMGVLVHPAFDKEIVNGVAITKNLYRDYEFGFVINIQKGEEEVVSPKAGVVCEQVVSYMNNAWAEFYNTSRSADWISFSGLNPQGSLLTSDELYALTQQLQQIKKYFYDVYRLWPRVEYKDFALDVEFKLVEDVDGKRKFVFKQARPYNN
jgi:pyruvate, water dikinase